MSALSIYIVEDEMLISASLSAQLGHYGYVISGSAVSGDQCLTDINRLSAEGREPEIVIMDINLRGSMDGIETARRISEKFDCAVIFLTGQSSREVYDKSFKIKPFGYLLKPIDIEQTQLTIEIAAHFRKLKMENRLYHKDMEGLLQRRSEEGREMASLYKMVIEHSLMGLSIVQNGRFVYANGRTAAIFSMVHEKLMAGTLEDTLRVVHPDDREQIYLLIEGANSGNFSTHIRVRIYSSDGKMKFAEVCASPMQFSGSPAVHLSFFDMSDTV